MQMVGWSVGSALIVSGNLSAQTPATAEPVQKLPSVAITSSPWEELPELAPLDASLERVHLSANIPLGQALEAMPAVTFSRRGANAVEPVIRGFSFDRITTLFNGLPLLNASPTRTTAPINFFRSGLIGQATVQRSFPSVTSGPITTGGVFSLASFPDHPSRQRGSDRSTAPRFTAQVRTFGNQHGISSGGSIVGQAGRVSYRIGAQYAKLGDYTGGNGVTVDADHESWGESAALRFALTPSQTLEVALHHYNTALDRNISLPFDTVDSDFYAATLNHTWQGDGQAIHLRLGYTEAHPYLSTSARPDDEADTPATPTPAPPAPGGPGGPGGPPGGGPPPAPPPARPINTDLHGDAIAYAAGLSWTKDWSPATATTVGVDATWSTRDVARDRLLSDNSINIDRLWPDVLIRDFGAFAEWTWHQNSTHVRFGARLDHVQREARAADASIIGIAGARGDTIRENYIGFNGPAAGITTREHTTGATHVVVEHDLNAAFSTHLGLGLTRMAPPPTESYRAFLSNPSGVADLGNPVLKPETKREIEWGIKYAAPDLHLSAQIFYAHVDDYIARRRILVAPTQVFSFRNADARFYGGEAALAWTPTRAPGWSVTATAANVRGKDLTTDIAQAGLPPWNATLSTRYQLTRGDRHYWISVEARHTAGKVNPNPTEAALFRDTAAYTLLDLRVGARVTSNLTLEASIENLFDREYYNYLTAYAATGPSAPPGSPPVIAAPNTLAPGDSVPGVGRSINLSARWSF